MKHTPVIQIDPNKPNADAVQQVGECLRAGGLVIIPTETVYGLAADATNPTAVAAIFAAKGRPGDNPLIVHVAESREVDAIAASIPEQARTLMDTFWPGPLTLVLPVAPGIPQEVTAGLSTVAVRMPAHPVAQAIIKAARCPLAAPSANRSGRPSPTRIEHLDEMDGRVDLMVDGGPCEVGLESTVLSMAGPKPRLLRPGGVSREQLEAIIGPVEVDAAVLDRLPKGVQPHSPGMKYRHYAPKAPMTLFRGPEEVVLSAMVGAVAQQQKAGGKRVGVLCFDGEENRFPGAVTLSLGTKGQPSQMAHSLFNALRTLDEADVDVIYSRMPAPGGVGLAVCNRLLKAAGHQVVDL